MSNDADNFAVSFHRFQVFLDDFLAQVILPLLGGLGESLLLGFVPSYINKIIDLGITRTGRILIGTRPRGEIVP